MSRPAELIDSVRHVEGESHLRHDTRSVKDILALMGWKADERMIDLGGSKGGDFRKRQPGKTEPAASPTPGSTAPATPSTDTPKPPVTDPFGTTPAAADPFGATPPAAAPPAGNVDPFK
jgi:hypothetical protein